MLHSGLKAVLAMAASVVFLIGSNMPASAQKGAAAPPPCRGTDYIDSLEKSDPAAYKRLRTLAGEIPNSNAVLWKIEGKGVVPSHLFGTVHVTDDRIHAMPKAAQDALAAAKTVALEVDDLSPVKMAAAFAKLNNLIVAPDGKSLAKQLDESELKHARSVLGRVGMPGEMINMVRPWLVAVMMAMPECEVKRMGAGLQPLDSSIQDKAKANKAQVVGLETIEDQLRAMASVPDETQIIMIKATLKLHNRLDDLFETTLSRYLKRDLGAIWALQIILTEKLGHPRSSLEAFEKSLIVVRNRKMRDGALPLLAKGNAFIAVGALHLPGKEGLVELLRAEGYTVAKVD
ncbi:MAG TPA: TraB/GumN family protein [Hyphomicrobiaceae bacterium]|nr:TraB/GumN family protein [Hyphomicrobiaceae bacterium]